MLEPYSLPRDVAYIVVSPDSDYILNNVKKFFKELSGAYEVRHLAVNDIEVVVASVVNP